jgi:hypothetical protein
MGKINEYQNLLSDIYNKNQDPEVLQDDFVLASISSDNACDQRETIENILKKHNIDGDI